MKYEHNRKAGAGDRAHQNQNASPDIQHSIRPGVPSPETVLVTVMTDGSYLLWAYPQREPAAFVVPDDAGPLREALTAAFGSPADRSQRTRDSR